MDSSPTQTETQPQADPKPKYSDPIFKAIGGIGRWHIAVVGMVALLKIPAAWHQMAVIFLAPPPSFRCKSRSYVPQNTVKYEENKNKTFTATIQTELNLKCDRYYLAHLPHAFTVLGILLGNFVFGMFGDRSGRRTILLIAILIQVIAGVLTAISPWFWLFCALKLVTAFGTGGTMVTSFVLVMEIIGPKWREFVTVLYQIPFTIGHLTLPFLAHFIRDWRWFQLAISLPSVVFISYYWLLPESPRWLMSTGKTERAVDVLKKAARHNRRPTDAILDKTDDRKFGQPKIWALFQTAKMHYKTIAICFNWFAMGFYFFGASQYIGNIGGPILTKSTIGTTLETPGALIAIAMMKYLGRRKSLMISNGVSGVMMMAIAFVVPHYEAAMITLSSLGILAMSVSFSNNYVFAGELFPTVVRNVGIGTASMCSRIGSLLAAIMINMLGITVPPLPPVMFASVALLGAIMTIWMPETLGKPLLETMEEA